MQHVEGPSRTRRVDRLERTVPVAFSAVHSPGATPNSLATQTMGMGTRRSNSKGSGDPSQATAENGSMQQMRQKPAGKDPRLRIVSWSLACFVLEDGQVTEQGHFSGIMPPGSSVFQGESQALCQLLNRVASSLDVTIDCKGIKQQAAKRILTKPAFARTPCRWSNS